MLVLLLTNDNQSVIIIVGINNERISFMNNKDAEILLNFLKDIMYSRRYQNLNVTILEPSSQDLGEGLNTLSKYVRECKKYIDDICDGKEVSKPETDDNPLLSHIVRLTDKLKEDNNT